jgi:hypothetical protein
MWLLMLAALSTSLLCEWGALHFIAPLFYLGFPGGIAMLIVIGGPHGPANHIQGVLGGISYVLVNTVFFFYVFRFFVSRLPSNAE